jgi:photosystem II stability/assembly factor-like uncharacterized protein
MNKTNSNLLHMKVTLLVVGIILPLILEAQWQPDTSFVTVNNLKTISCVSELKAFITECDLYQSSWSINGLYYTNDSGNTWNSSIGSEMCPATSYFLNESVGYLVTTGSMIGATAMRKTVDGGTTWADINYSFPTSHQKGLFFVDENIGYYGSGDGFYIHKTIDGGNSWITQNTGSANAVIDAIFFLNKDTGFIAGWYSPKIAKTINGGQTWTDVSNTYGIYALDFPSEMVGYAVGANMTNSPVIIKSTDMGDTWSVVYTASTANPFFFSDIHCLTDNICYVTGANGTILKTTNGGATWQSEVSGTTKKLNGISCTDDGQCFVVGDSGILLKNTVNLSVSSMRRPLVVSVHPSPFTTTATVSTAEALVNGSMVIYNDFGVAVRRYERLNGNTFIIHRETLPIGMYYLKVICEHNNIFAKFAIN